MKLMGVLALAMALAAAPAGAADNLLTNGDFEALPQNNKLPGWPRVAGSGDLVVKTENNNRYLSITNDGTRGVSTEQRVAVGPSGQRMRLAGRMRVHRIQPGAKSHQTARVQTTWLDANNKTVSPWPQSLSRHEATRGWVELEEEFVVPAGVVSLSVAPALFEAAGAVDFDDLVLTVVDPDEVRLPKDRPLTWDKEPEETLSPTRARINLNGVWKFCPAIGENETTPRNWGYMPVPGNWATPALGGIYSLPHVAARGKGAAWQTFKGGLTAPEWNALGRAWYERPLRIPASFANRRVTLDFSRISTDARVYLDNQEVGRVAWPGGTVDITRRVRPGQTHTLRLLVVAAGNADVETVFMGTAANQIETRTAVLKSRGITNDVFLMAEPQGARVAGVFVQPSTRKKQLALDVDIEGAQAGTLALTARCLNEKGAVEKAFPAQRVAVRPGAQTVRITLPWTNPRLWDLNRPNTYTLRLKAEGAGLNDDFAQPFGFREFWIENRKFLFNGTEIRLRPNQSTLNPMRDGVQIEAIDGAIDGLRAAGHNIEELWPNNFNARGEINFQDLYLERADKKGWPVIASLGSMAGLTDKWTDAAGKPTPERLAWETNLREQLKRERNHPSCVLWIHSANRFGNWDDQNPRRVGHAGRLLEMFNPEDRRKAEVGMDANRIIKKLDPTRAVSTHQGGPVGDWHTNNNYLNFIPFQEQEEWLSEWVQTGDRPYMPVEFSFILGCDFKRGRLQGGWGRGQGATYTEHWTTEFLAGFYGPTAYREETPAQREIHAKQLLADAKIDSTNKPLSPDWERQYYKDRPDYIVSRLTEDLFYWNYRDVYRSWRTMGTTGGMIPWEYEKGWVRNNEQERVAAFAPGRRGAYHPSVAKWKLYYLQPQGATRITPRGQALLETNAPTLAWIVGADVPGDNAAFASKDHSYRGGSRLGKRVALLNDTRGAQTYQVTWRVTLGERAIGTQTKTGRIAPAQTLFVPIEQALPGVTAKTNGVIRMTARIGTAEHKNEFAFRVFPKLEPARGRVAVFDPVGKTSTLLKRLGYAPHPWDGQAKGDLLVIGREALSQGHKLPGDLGAFVRGGGRALLMTQHPDYLRRTYGFRVGTFLPRSVYAIDAKHPVMAGLDDDDLRDWSGHSTLVGGKPVLTEKDKSPSGYPVRGWHWGNRGVVATAFIEKPHRSSWRPILETDFDLQYTPLMEMEHGAGRLTLCTLDLEDHAHLDPAAEKIAANLLRHAQKAPLAPKAERVFFWGDDTGATQLTNLGVRFTRVQQMPQGPGLLVAEPSALDGSKVAASEPFFRAGGQAFVLAKKTADNETLVKAEFSGSQNVPAWDACRGLSVSDLRWRAPHDAIVLRPSQATSGEVGADGLLARVVVGPGQVIHSQIDPDALPADTATYFRFTRWRQTRALSQLLANLGATFGSDTEFFDPSLRSATRLPLDGDFKVLVTQTLPSATSITQTDDPGITPAARAAVAPNYDDAPLPSTPAKQIEAFDAADGEAVFRQVVDVPTAFAGQDLRLTLGTVDDFDNTFWNGEEIGKTGGETANPYGVARVYTIPGRLVRAGRNVLAIRVFDRYGGGGLSSTRGVMNLQTIASLKQEGELYHGDYIGMGNYKLSDDPHRYYRW